MKALHPSSMVTIIQNDGMPQMVLEKRIPLKDMDMEVLSFTFVSGKLPVYIQYIDYTEKKDIKFILDKSFRVSINENRVISILGEDLKFEMNLFNDDKSIPKGYMKCTYPNTYESFVRI